MIFDHDPIYFLKDFRYYIIFLVVASVLLIFAASKTYKSSTSLSRKKVLLSLFFSIFLVIFIFSFFEAYFKYVYDESDGLGFLKTNARWQQRHVTYNAYNNYFFRNNRDFTPDKKEGVTRIGVLGDSNAFGAGIKDVNNRFSNVLEKELNDAGYKVEIYNLAIPGIGTEREKEVYQGTKDLNFDIIILSYFLNKAQPENSSTGTSIIVKNSQRAKVLEFISSKSYFLDFLYWRFSSVYENTIKSFDAADLAQYRNDPVITAHKELLKSMLDQFKTNNSKVVIVIFPYINLIQPKNPLFQEQLFADRLMNSFFMGNGVDTVNLLDYIEGQNPQTLMASRFDAHPNEIVHKLAADKLFQIVAPLVGNRK